MSMIGKIKAAVGAGTENLKTQVGRFKNRKFMEGVVAVCVRVAMASDGASSEEKQKMIAFIRNSEELKVFDVDEIIKFFNELCSKYDFDAEIGRGEATKYIVRLKDSPEAAQLAVRVGIAIGKSDGDFDKDEQRVAREICLELDLDPEAFQL